MSTLLEWCKLNNRQDLLDEWDNTKNANYSPSKVSKGAEIKIWWKCSICGNSWNTYLYSRTGKHPTSCPKCSVKNKKIVIKQSLYDWCKKNKREDILDEWNTEKNELNGDTIYNVTPYSNKKYFFICKKCGKEYINRPLRGCPNCGIEKGKINRSNNLLKNREILGEKYPQIFREWNSSLNDNKSPNDFTANSNKYIILTCPDCNGTYKTKITVKIQAYKNNTKGCPYCSREKVLTGYNDLATTNPELLDEWDYEKNIDIDPAKILSGTNKKVWWKCKTCGYEWNAQISSRAGSQKTGCPACKHEVVWTGHNDLETLHPNLAKEWCYEKNEKMPSEVMPYSNKKYYWICNEGHIFQSTCADRMSSKGCPICANKQILVGYNDLATTNPKLKEEWDYSKNDISPNEVTKGSDKKVWWLCDMGHSWEASISSRTSNGNGCPYCSSGLQASLPEKSIIYYLHKYFNYNNVNFDIEENIKPKWLNGYELDVWIPKINLAIEYDGKKWHQNIQKDLNKDLLIKNNKKTLIRIRENGCPDYETSAILFKASSYTRTLNHMTEALKFIFEYISSAFNLKMYEDIDISRDYIDIQQLLKFPMLEDSLENNKAVKDWNYDKNGILKPNMFKKNSNKSVWWKCHICGYEWQAVIESRCGNGRNNGCPSCSGNITIAGVNDLFTTNPELENLWDYGKNTLKPSEIRKGSNKKAFWKCQKGHSWSAVINSVAIGRRCPYCANQKLLKGFNDLASQNPELLVDWNFEKNGDLKPEDVQAGSDKNVWWKCHICGYEWQAKPYTRTKKHCGCIKCRKNKI